MVAGAKILPEYHYLIIDEAHHLEQEATKQLGSEITQRELLDYLSRLDRKVEGQHRMGFLSKLRELLTLSTVIPLRRTHLEQLSGDLRSRVNKARAQGSQFFDILGRFIWEYADEQGEYDRHLRLTQNTRGKRAWSEVESAWDDLNLALKDIADALNGLYIGLADLFEGRLPDYENFMLELSSLLYANEELQRRINSLVSHPEANDIYWLSLSGENNLLSLCTAPLTVAGILEKQLFSAKECVVLTGATLSTEGNFEYIKQRLGLDEANELALGSPFDYLSSTLVYIPGDIPEPGEPGAELGLIHLPRCPKNHLGCHPSPVGGTGHPCSWPWGRWLAEAAFRDLQDQAQSCALGHLELLGRSRCSGGGVERPHYGQAPLQRPHRPHLLCPL
jgi:DNA polymerase-3 subunit epsilon/ATP-dependent DNA helicase DinG